MGDGLGIRHSDGSTAGEVGANEALAAPPSGLVLLAHNCTHFEARFSGRMLMLSGFQGSKGRRIGGGLRGEVRAFSDDSRMRLLQTVAAIPWDQLGAVLMVTLTYPGEAEYVPRSGKAAKAHLRAFRMRWERRWGPMQAVWKLEFQRRGAIHWMLCVVAPRGVSLTRLREWVSWSWWQIVGSGRETHKRAGTQVKVWQGDPSWYFAKYATKGGHLDKEYQHEVPSWMLDVGRWWGVWRLRPEWCRVSLTESEFAALRRVVVRLRRSRGHRRYRVRGLRGCWLVSKEQSGQLAASLLRWLEQGG